MDRKIGYDGGRAVARKATEIARKVSSAGIRRMRHFERDVEQENREGKKKN